MEFIVEPNDTEPDASTLEGATIEFLSPFYSHREGEQGLVGKRCFVNHPDVALLMADGSRSGWLCFGGLDTPRWFIHAKIITDKVTTGVSAKSATLPPKNNDGRTNCFWCGSPTRKAGGGSYDVCTKKGCER